MRTLRSYNISSVLEIKKISIYNILFFMSIDHFMYIFPPNILYILTKLI